MPKTKAPKNPVAQRVRDHARALVAGAQTKYDIALVRQATGQPQTMTRRKLLDLIARAGHTPDEFDREADDLREFIDARRLLAGRTRAGIEAHDAKLAKAHDAALAVGDKAAAVVDAKHQELRETADEAERADADWRRARAKLADPKATPKERAEAEQIVDQFGDTDPARYAHEARRAVVEFEASKPGGLKELRNEAIRESGEPARAYCHWREKLPAIRHALDVVERVTPRIAALAKAAPDPQPEPERTAEDEAEAWTAYQRDHWRKIEQVAVELAGTGRGGK